MSDMKVVSIAPRPDNAEAAATRAQLQVLADSIMQWHDDVGVTSVAVVVTTTNKEVVTNILRPDESIFTLIGAIELLKHNAMKNVE